MMAKVFVKERKARPFWFGHPWVFSGAIEKVRGQPEPGGIVELCDHAGQSIGQGFWNQKSQITVRLVALTHEGPLDQALLETRLQRAIEMRESVWKLSEVTNAYRVVHSEGDGLPGLIVDRVADILVVQVSCLGMIPFLDPLLASLEARFQPRAILERPSRVALEEEGLDRPANVMRGTLPTDSVELHEHGVRYVVDAVEGQKTGWFSDQRDNRRLVASLAQGRTVLDAFSYVGGFGLACAKAGASAVRCVDSSEPAIESVRKGAELQGLGALITADKANVLRSLDHDAQEGRTYELVIVDPPKFVHKRASLARGLRLYYELNLKAIRVTKRGGILVTNSCSQHVLESHFEEMLTSVAKESGVRLQEMARGGQSPDHPVTYPLDESRYLKCRVLRVI